MGLLIYAKLLSVGLVPIPEASATVINAFKEENRVLWMGLCLKLFSRVMLKMDQVRIKNKEKN